MADDLPKKQVENTQLLPKIVKHRNTQSENKSRWRKKKKFKEKQGLRNVENSLNKNSLDFMPLPEEKKKG